MQLFTNNADTSLNGAIDTVATSLTVKTGEGTKFPSPTGGDFFLITLYQKLGTSELNHEILKCTARSGDVFTVVRAQEGTSAKAFNNTDPVELRITAGTLTAKQDVLVSNTHIKTVNSTSLLGSGNLVTGDVTLAGIQTLTDKTLTGYTETTYALAGTDIAVANGSIQTKTLAANTTFTESLADGQSVILGITAGAYSVTWPSVTWAKVGGSGVAPTLTSTGVNWVILWQVGSVVRGSFMGTA